MDAQRTAQDVDQHDGETIEAIEKADELIHKALMRMPNDKRSVFDPANDVPALQTARDRLRLVLLGAYGERRRLGRG